MKSSESIALSKADQKQHSKKINQIKKNIQVGKITIKERNLAKRQKEQETSGLIYIGHIPHGFYEEEIKGYFSQFGQINHVKVCRSKKTGNSKGFGYVEFTHEEVAKIAAETMNNYLMFKKRLIVNFVPNEKRPKALFSGNNASTPKKFTARTRWQKQRAFKNKVIDEKTVEKKEKTTLSRLNKKLEKLKSYGIDHKVEVVDAKNKISPVRSSRKSKSSEIVADKIEKGPAKLKMSNKGSDKGGKTSPKSVPKLKKISPKKDLSKKKSVGVLAVKSKGTKKTKSTDKKLKAVKSLAKEIVSSATDSSLAKLRKKR